MSRTDVVSKNIRLDLYNITNISTQRVLFGDRSFIICMQHGGDIVLHESICFPSKVIVELLNHSNRK
jgi:hypothetical protein